jgi:hypothetical protein
MKLLVGSVYASGEPQQLEWLGLQKQFLNKTTEDYDLCAYVSHPDISEFKDVNVIANRADDPRETHCSILHVEGLRCLRDYFVTQKDNYDAFLFLDSDAFPVKQDWLPTLVTRMGQQTHKKDCAAIVRAELCEMRYHASVLFCLPAALDGLQFLFGQVTNGGVEGQDLLGNYENDIHISYQRSPDRCRVFPLLRTNRYNIHPVACGIYYDMFYHHAFGSEHGVKKNTEPFQSLRNAGKYGYGIDWSGGSYDFRDLYNRIMDTPSEFVRRLGGWSDNYAWVRHRKG